MTKTQQRVAKVLERLTDMANEDADNAEALAPSLEDMLNELASNDFFGTEQQCDPRGDFRNGQWSMEKVEGIDEQYQGRRARKLNASRDGEEE